MPGAKSAEAQSRQQIEQELLAAVKQAEADFHSAPADQKEAAGPEARHRVPPAAHGPADPSHRSGSIHDDPAGAG